MPETLSNFTKIQIKFMERQIQLHYMYIVEWIEPNYIKLYLSKTKNWMKIVPFFLSIHKYVRISEINEITWYQFYSMFLTLLNPLWICFKYNSLIKRKKNVIDFSVQDIIAIHINLYVKIFPFLSATTYFVALLSHRK